MNLLFIQLIFSLFFMIGCQVKSSKSDIVYVDHTPTDFKWTVRSPPQNTYGLGSTLTYFFKSAQVITVEGSPRVPIKIGSSIKFLQYQSGSGTNELRFNYTVVSPDEDQAGVTLLPAIDLNGGKISLEKSVPAPLSFAPPSSKNIFIDAKPPVITSVIPTAPKIHIFGDVISLLVTVNEDVAVSGSARIPIRIGGTTKYANYAGGSESQVLIFNYSVPVGEFDLDGIEVLSDALEISGSIKDKGGNSLLTKLDTFVPLPDLSNHYIDSVAPTIVSITKPGDKIYKAGENLDFSLKFSEAVSIAASTRLIITLNTGLLYANYQSGNGSDEIGFRAQVSPGQLDLDGISLVATVDLNGGVPITDTVGNLANLGFTSPPTNGILVDAVIPTITIQTPAIINLANRLNYSLQGTCSEDGQPVIVKIGTLVINPSPSCSAGNWELLNYDVSVIGDSTSLSIEVNHSDLAGNAATQINASVLKDTVAPYVMTVNGTNGNYRENDVMIFSLGLNEVVQVTPTPSLVLNLTSGLKSLSYYSGSGTSSLGFNYTVAAEDIDLNGVTLGSQVTMNSGGIVDAAGNPLVTTLPTTSFPGVTVIPAVSLNFANTSDHGFGQIPLGGSSDITLLVDHVSGTASSVTSSFSNPDFNFKGGVYPGQGGTCITSISSDCTIVVTYTPSSAAVDTGTLTINYTGGSFTKNFTGEGVSLTPTKLQITSGPPSAITNTCIPYVISTLTDSNLAANVTTNRTVNLVVNNGTGLFFSDSGCVTTITSTVISSGTSSRMIYFRSTLAGQSLTLIFNTTGLSNTSYNVTTSNPPTKIFASSAVEIVTGICSPVEVSLTDNAGIKTGASTSKVINFSNNSSASFYLDSFCTQQISQIDFAIFQGTNNIYVKNETAEVANFSFTDSASILTSDNHDITFVSSLTWWDTDWSKRRRITLNNLDQAEAHTNIPILVRLNTSRINYSDLMANGEDLRFVLSDHTTVLKHEIDTWNPSGESLVWVRVPIILASSQMDIYLYYDNPAAISVEDPATLWTGYAGVWHMKKNGAQYVDSTGSGKNGTVVGTLTEVSGPSGIALSFNGSSSLNTGYNLSQVIGRSSTLSFWIRTTQVGNNTNWQAPGITGVEQSGGSNDIFFGFIRADGRLAVNSGNTAAVTSNFVVNDNNWRYVTMSRNETTGLVKFYVNGVLNGSATSDIGAKTTAFTSFGVIADTGGTPMHYNGLLDGLRLEDSVQTDGRVRAEYKYLVETHMSYGPLEEL